MKKREVIVAVGTAGGTIALYGTRTDRGWNFEREVHDGTLDLLDEEPVHANSRGVENWDAALRLLDRYRWPTLVPLSVHPDFRLKISDAVRVRLGDNTPAAQSELDRWREICGRTTYRNELHIPFYRNELHNTFKKYRASRFATHEQWFEDRPEPGPVVFTREHADDNLLVPPCSKMERERIVGAIPRLKRTSISTAFRVRKR
jgi:hypothetical protein